MLTEVGLWHHSCRIFQKYFTAMGQQLIAGRCVICCLRLLVLGIIHSLSARSKAASLRTAEITPKTSHWVLCLCVCWIQRDMNGGAEPR